MGIAHPFLARMRHVSDAAAILEPFICDVVKPGSIVLTDGWSGHSGLPERGYRHKATPPSQAGQSTEASMHGVRRVAVLLERWILGTPPRLRRSRPPAVQPGGAYLSLQPAQLKQTRPGLSPADRAGGGHEACHRG